MNSKTFFAIVSGFFLAVLIFGVSELRAEEDSLSAAPLTADTEVVVVEEVKPVEDEGKKLGPNEYFFDFKKTKVIHVLGVLSELTGMNFVAGSEIADREVTMLLDRVSLEDVLEALSRGSNISYEYVPERRMYLFRAAADSPNLPPLMTRVFKLFYLMASQLREIESSEGSSGSSGSSSSGSSGFTNLSETSVVEITSPILKVVQNMLSERGKVNVDDRSNSLVVTDTEDRLRMIEPVIAQLDHKLDQVLIEVVLVETFEDLERHLGVEWSSATSEGTFAVVTGGSAPTKFPFDLKWPGGKEIFEKEGIVSDIGDDTLDLDRGFGTQDFTSLTMRVKALEIANKLKVLAKPRILVLDNHPSLIKITTNAAIGSNTVATATGQLSSSATTTTERTETGTSLRLTPHINTNGNITLTLEPRFVTLATSSLSNTTADPTIRAARTTMMVKHGQTIAMGGLLTSQQTNTNRKVPIIGDIPFIGEPFTKKTKNLEDRELVLFITPFIIKDTSVLQAHTLPDRTETMEEATKPFWKRPKKALTINLKEERTTAARDNPTEIFYEEDRFQTMDRMAQQLAEAGKDPAPLAKS